MPESRGKGLKPPKVDYNLKFLGLYAFLGISFSYLKLTHGKPLCVGDWETREQKPYVLGPDENFCL